MNEATGVVTIDYAKDAEGHRVGVQVVGVRGIDAEPLRRFENFLAVVAAQRTAAHPLSSFDVESALRAAMVCATVRWREFCLPSERPETWPHVTGDDMIALVNRGCEEHMLADRERKTG